MTDNIKHNRYRFFSVNELNNLHEKEFRLNPITNPNPSANSNPNPNPKYKELGDRIQLDFVAMSTFAGNDYLPKMRGDPRPTTEPNPNMYINVNLWRVVQA